MNKLRLHLEDLRVETFATDGEGPGARGTVRAQATGYYTLCQPYAWTCPECAQPDTESCPAPCTGDCGGSGGGGTVGGTQTRTDV